MHAIARQHQNDETFLGLGIQTTKPLLTAGILVWGGGTWRIIPGQKYVVNNHGDCRSSKDRATWDPFQMASIFVAYHGGDPNHLRPSWEPILQVDPIPTWMSQEVS